MVEKIHDIIQSEEILIEGYDKEKIYKILIQQIKQFPPIKELTRLVLRDINYHLQPREDRNIEIMYSIRNHFYHHSIELESLYGRIICNYEDITQFNLASLKNEIKYFKKFLRRITGGFFHTRLFENLKKTTSNLIYCDQHTITWESNANEYYNNIIQKLEETYCQEKKYIHLLKFILEKADKYENNFKTLREIEGICFDVDNHEYITFQLNFINKFQAQGTFQGNIGYPRVYNFFINLRRELDNFPSILKFTEVIYMSFSSNIHNIHIRILDYWINYERALEHHNYLLDNFL